MKTCLIIIGGYVFFIDMSNVQTVQVLKNVLGVSVSDQTKPSWLLSLRALVSVCATRVGKLACFAVCFGPHCCNALRIRLQWRASSATRTSS